MERSAWWATCFEKTDPCANSCGNGFATEPSVDGLRDTDSQRHVLELGTRSSPADAESLDETA
jgi:hypothetical protein